jgi:DNA (cytosine-5)-methyltransferase 1
MNADEWSRYACNLLKAELARSGVGYEELVSRLDSIGVQETYKGLAAKINRGTFSFVFFAQCMSALGTKTVRLGE